MVVVVCDDVVFFIVAMAAAAAVVVVVVVAVAVLGRFAALDASAASGVNERGPSAPGGRPEGRREKDSFEMKMSFLRASLLLFCLK
jgi:hypothetical protein